MAVQKYNKSNWKTGDVITQPKMNNIETGIELATDEILSTHSGRGFSPSGGKQGDYNTIWNSMSHRFDDITNYLITAVAGTADGEEALENLADRLFGVIVAQPFSQEETYSIGDYCLYNQKLWKCVKAAESGHEFNYDDNWQECIITDEIINAKNNIDIIQLNGNNYTGVAGINGQKIANLGSAVTSISLGDTMDTSAGASITSTGTINVKNKGITTGKLADGAVTAAQLGTNAVETAKIKDLNVTEGKLANSAVTTNKLNDGAVTNVKVAANAIDTLQIKDEAVTNAKITNPFITIAGQEVRLGASITDVQLLDKLGLGQALRFVGITTLTNLDGTTTNPNITGYDFTKVKVGDLIINKNDSTEYVWTDEREWELLGAESHYKTIQTAVSSPTVQNNKTAIEFIDTIIQDTNGVITPTKAKLLFGTAANTAAEGNHVHGNISNTGTIGTSKQLLITNNNGQIVAATPALSAVSNPPTGDPLFINNITINNDSITFNRAILPESTDTVKGVVNKITNMEAGWTYNQSTDSYTDNGKIPTALAIKQYIDDQGFAKSDISSSTDYPYDTINNKISTQRGVREALASLGNAAEKNIYTLTNEQLEELVTEGTVIINEGTANEQTITYSDDDIYITPPEDKVITITFSIAKTEWVLDNNTNTYNVSIAVSNATVDNTYKAFIDLGTSYYNLETDLTVETYSETVSGVETGYVKFTTALLPIGTISGTIQLLKTEVPS